MSATRLAAVLTACSTSIGASPGAADSDRYTDTGSAPATSASCIASSRNGLPVGRITRRGHRCDPGPRAPAASRGINPALSSDDLPAPDSPATSSIPVPSSRPASRCTSWADQLAAPVKNPRVPLLEWHQPQIRASRATPGRQRQDRPRPRTAASTSAAGARPRAAATNKGRTGSARPSAPASNSAVSLRAVRLMPRSRSLTDRGLRPAASASSSCVSLASARSCRSNPANPSAGCSAMVGIPSAGLISPRGNPARSGTALQTIIQARPPSPSPASQARRRWAAGRTGARHRTHCGSRQGPRLARKGQPRKRYTLAAIADSTVRRGRPGTALRPPCPEPGALQIRDTQSTVSCLEPFTVTAAAGGDHRRAAALNVSPHSCLVSGPRSAPDGRS